MVEVIYAMYGVVDGVDVSNVSNVKFDFVRYFRHGLLEVMTHDILFFLVTGENADFYDVGL